MRRLHSAKRKALLDIVGVWVCFFEMKSVRKVFSSTPLVATTNGVIELRFYELEQVCGAALAKSQGVGGKEWEPNKRPKSICLEPKKYM